MSSIEPTEILKFVCISLVDKSTSEESFVAVIGTLQRRYETVTTTVGFKSV